MCLLVVVVPSLVTVRGGQGRRAGRRPVRRGRPPSQGPPAPAEPSERVWVQVRMLWPERRSTPPVTDRRVEPREVGVSEECGVYAAVGPDVDRRPRVAPPRPPAVPAPDGRLPRSMSEWWPRRVSDSSAVGPVREVRLLHPRPLEEPTELLQQYRTLCLPREVPPPVGEARSPRSPGPRRPARPPGPVAPIPRRGRSPTVSAHGVDDRTAVQRLDTLSLTPFVSGRRGKTTTK